MRLRDRVRAFFDLPPVPRPVCDGCEAYRTAIQVQKEHIEFLQQEFRSMEQALYRATRIHPEQIPVAARGQAEPIPGGPVIWDKVRGSLEKRYRRKQGEDNTPADQVQDYWENKVAAQESEAGIAR